MILNRMYSLSTLCYTVWVTFLLLYCFCPIPLLGVFQSFLYSTNPNKILILLFFCSSPHHFVNWMQKFPGPLCCRSLGKKCNIVKEYFRGGTVCRTSGRWMKTHYYSFSPWLSSSLTAPPVIAPVTFASIVEEELQQEAALIRSREKPLALIQVKNMPKV